ALRDTTLQRHLTALKADLGIPAAARMLALVATTSRFAHIGAGPTANTLGGDPCSFVVMKIVEFHLKLLDQKHVLHFIDHAPVFRRVLDLDRMTNSAKPQATYTGSMRCNPPYRAFYQCHFYAFVCHVLLSRP